MTRAVDNETANTRSWGRSLSSQYATLLGVIYAIGLEPTHSPTTNVTWRTGD
jgi:hypothetical protein